MIAVKYSLIAIIKNTTAMALSISIVIPNYNGKSLLQLNLPYVYSALFSSEITDFEIIVADDASIDGSVEFLKNSFPNVIIIESDKNCGFAGNTNRGIFAAKKELVFILNSDVQLTNNYFSALLPYFDKPDTFGVSGQIISMDGTTIQDGAKFPEYQFANIISTKNYISENKIPLYSLFMSGANALIHRQKLIQMGGFNTLFNPYYSEDVDLGLRAWRLGYRIYYEHQSVCRHPNSATIAKEPSNRVKIVSKRNKMYLHFIHLSGFELAFFIAKISIKLIFRSLIGDVNFAKSTFQFYSSFGKLLNEKSKLKHIHKDIKLKTTREIMQYIQVEIGGLKIKKF